VCNDASGELLSSTQYEGPLDKMTLNPLVLSAPPSLFTRMGVGATETYVSLLDGGVLDEVALTKIAGTSDSFTRTETQTVVGPARALAARNGTAYLLNAEGLEGIAANGSTWNVPMPDAIGLRYSPPGIAILIQDAGYRHVVDTPPVTTVTLPGSCAADPVIDLELLQAHANSVFNIFLNACLLAASPSGLFFQNYGDGGAFLLPSDAGGGLSPSPVFQPVPWGTFYSPTCGSPPETQIRQLFPAVEGVGVSLYDPVVGYEAALIAYDGLTTDAGVGASCPSDLPCCGRLGSVVLRCPVCAHSQLAEVRPVAVAPTPFVIVRCVDPASSSSSWFSVSSVGPICSDPFPQFEGSGLFVDHVTFNSAFSGDLAYAGDHGELWLGGTNRFDETPAVLSSRPAFFFEPDSGVQAVSFTVLVDDTGLVTPFQDIWAYSSGQGLIRWASRQGTVQIAGVVRNQPSWIILQNLNVKDTDLPPTGADIVAIGSMSLSPVQVSGGELVPTPDGRFQLVVTDFDTVLVADITARLDGGSTTPGTFAARAVPAPGNQLAAISFFHQNDAGQVLGPNGQAVWMRAYALTQNGVVDLVAHSATDWDVTPVDIPNGTPIGLGRDQNRFRVGLSDGTVDSLPSLVPLSSPIPETPPVVSAYATLCGEVYALGASALYRLVAIPGAGTGQWIPEPADGGALFPNAPPLTFGNAFAIGGHLYVGTRFGGVVRMEPPGGCP
jgi:hypothetical protein